MKSRTYQKGMTLIELMVSVVLGLIVVGGVVSVLLSNKASYRTNEGLSQIQETARTAFEIMARDIRQAGGAGCDNAQRMANALVPGTAWWQNWSSIQGYDAGATDPAVASSSSTGERVSTTDSLELMGIDGQMYPILSHNPAGGVMVINAASTTFGTGDILLVCDFDHTTTFQASAYDAATVSVSHAAASGSPGNCSQGLGFPVDCSSVTGNVYLFKQNSQIGKLSAVDWYVGNNGRTTDVGTSLFRRRLGPNATVVTEEIVSGVTDMQIQYGVNGSDTINNASALVGAAAWNPVNSVFITLTVQSTDSNVSTDNTVNSGRLSRTFSYLITLRNRVQ